MRTLENFVMYDDEDLGGSSPESKLIEGDDGDLAIAIETEEEPATDSDKEQSQEDNSGADEVVVEEDAKYAGKTREELIAMNNESTKYGSEKAQEASKYKQSVKTRDDVKGVVTAKELRKAVDEQVKKVEAIDAVLDPEDRAKAQVVLETMKLDLQEKREEERYSQLVSGEANRIFLADHKTKLNDQGIAISDDEYAKVSEKAADYAEEGGRITSRSIVKAIIDEFGDEKYATFLQTAGEQKARADISKAAVKEDVSITTVASGKTSKTKSVKTMSDKELIAYNRTLSPADQLKLKNYLRNPATWK